MYYIVQLYRDDGTLIRQDMMRSELEVRTATPMIDGSTELYGYRVNVEESIGETPQTSATTP